MYYRLVCVFSRLNSKCTYFFCYSTLTVRTTSYETSLLTIRLTTDNSPSNVLILMRTIINIIIIILQFFFLYMQNPSMRETMDDTLPVIVNYLSIPMLPLMWNIIILLRACEKSFTTSLKCPFRLCTFSRLEFTSGVNLFCFLWAPNQTNRLRASIMISYRK